MSETDHYLEGLVGAALLRDRAFNMKRVPKILFIQTQAENAGAQEISRLLAQKLAPRGHEVHHLFLYRKTDGFTELPNTIYCANERPGSPMALGALLIRLVSQIRAINPDLVITFQHYGNLIGAPAARIAGVKHVIANQVSAQATMSAMVRRLDRWFGSLGLYDIITVNSAHTAGKYGAFPKTYTKRIVHVPHGFRDKSSPLSKEEARRKFGLPQGVTMLGSVGRLNVLKRLDVAINALAHDDGWHLVLGGQGPERESLVALARELGVQDRLHLTGELDPDEVGDLLAAMDLFVFPTAAETFGLAAVEAAQSGLPMVANGISVLREVLQTTDGPCALFADSNDPDSFVAPIRQILSDKDLADQLIKSSSKLKDHHSLDAMVDLYDWMITTMLELEAVEQTA